MNIKMLPNFVFNIRMYKLKVNLILMSFLITSEGTLLGRYS